MKCIQAVVFCLPVVVGEALPLLLHLLMKVSMQRDIHDCIYRSMTLTSSRSVSPSLAPVDVRKGALLSHLQELRPSHSRATMGGTFFVFLLPFSCCYEGCSRAICLSAAVDLWMVI